jgi:hypothetical protein
VANLQQLKATFVKSTDAMPHSVPINSALILGNVCIQLVCIFEHDGFVLLGRQRRGHVNAGKAMATRDVIDETAE